MVLLQQGTDNAELLGSPLQGADSETCLFCSFQQVALPYRAILKPRFQQPFWGVHVAGMSRVVPVDDVVGSQVAQFTQRRNRDELLYHFAVKIGQFTGHVFQAQRHRPRAGYIHFRRHQLPPWQKLVLLIFALHQEKRGTQGCNQLDAAGADVDAAASNGFPLVTQHQGRHAGFLATQHERPQDAPRAGAIVQIGVIRLQVLQRVDDDQPKVMAGADTKDPLDSRLVQARVGGPPGRNRQ